MKISVVSPVFNEQECVGELCRRLTDVLPALADDYEILLVDDGSGDDSWAQIAGLAARDRHIKGLRFSRNFGHHYAITAGLDACDGDWMVVMDSDLQDRPEAIPDLIAKALEGYDIVLARRMQREFSWFKNLSARIFYRLFRYLTGTEHDGTVGVFRVMSRRVVNALRQLPESDRFFPSLVYWVGFKQSHITVKHDARFAGETKYPLGKQIALAVSATLSFSDKPIVLVVNLGLCVVALSFLVTCYVFIRAMFFGFAVLGYASIMASIFFTGGCMLATIGLVGLYVGRIFRQVKGRPLYLVSEAANIPAKEPRPVL